MGMGQPYMEHDKTGEGGEVMDTTHTITWFCGAYTAPTIGGTKANLDGACDTLYTTPQYQQGRMSCSQN